MTLLLTILTCPIIKMINLTNEDWTLIDKQMMFYASDRCTQVYYQSPCLVKFTKTDIQTYQAICGSKR